MPSITVNAEPKLLPDPLTVEDLLRLLGKDPKKLAVEVNRAVVPRTDHPSRRLENGDTVEIVTLVGGGSGIPSDSCLKVGGFTFQSRLFTGTGKYTSYELMQQCMDASGCEVTTVAVRRERLIDKEGKSLLDFLNLKKLTILPNTAGCFSAEDAIRHARLARELLTNLENPGANWVKLECLADKKTLLPDPVDTLKATEQLVKEGFTVLVYTSDDPVLAKRLKAAGAASVMPAGSPIGSGQGILNPNNIRICLEYLKEGDPNYPVIVDAGVGTASDVSTAMELGCDGVLLNTAIAGATDPLRMAWAMRYACDAGRLAYLAGRIPKKLYANASSPTEGMIQRS
ncbi:MAG TPA: sulfur carrier protein ThiS [Gemmata sp.]|jgi:thiazole synthase|nr:sulfur carrier protein ThiS [Gemmata sp.]